MSILSFDVGIINLAYCIIDASSLITHWEIITIEKTENYNKLYVSLIKALDERPHLLDSIENVIIEKQPSFNPKMRIIAGCLQTYFIIRGIVDRPLNGIKSVDFFNPKHKLKCYTGPELVIQSNAKSKYARTKKMGILIAQHFLQQETPEIVTFFMDCKKKDDLSDCYLQALTFQMSRNDRSVFYNNNNVPKKKVKYFTKKEIKVELARLKSFDGLSEDLQKSILSRFQFQCFPLNQEQQTTILQQLSLKKVFQTVK
jgi:hypothetical protein